MKFETFLSLCPDVLLEDLKCALFDYEKEASLEELEQLYEMKDCEDELRNLLNMITRYLNAVNTLDDISETVGIKGAYVFSLIDNLLYGPVVFDGIDQIISLAFNTENARGIIEN